MNNKSMSARQVPARTVVRVLTKSVVTNATVRPASKVRTVISILTTVLDILA